MRWTLLSIAVAVAGCAPPPGDGPADTGDASGVGDAASAADAGGSGRDDGASLAPTYATVQTILRASCSGYCHGGGSAVGMSLVLAPEDGTPPTLVARASREVPRLMLVAPGDPDASYLMIKLDGTMASQPECAADASVCGYPMPSRVPGRVTLSEAERAAVRGWIAAGAPGPSSP